MFYVRKLQLERHKIRISYFLQSWHINILSKYKLLTNSNLCNLIIWLFLRIPAIGQEMNHAKVTLDIPATNTLLIDSYITNSFQVKSAIKP